MTFTAIDFETANYKRTSACLNYHNIKADIPDFFCTVQGSRKELPSLRNHKLSTVCSYYGIQLNHHEALSDARGAAGIALALNREKLKKYNEDKNER